MFTVCDRVSFSKDNWSSVISRNHTFSNTFDKILFNSRWIIPAGSFSSDCAIIIQCARPVACNIFFFNQYFQVTTRATRSEYIYYYCIYWLVEHLDQHFFLATCKDFSREGDGLKNEENSISEEFFLTWIIFDGRASLNLRFLSQKCTLFLIAHWYISLIEEKKKIVKQ